MALNAKVVGKERDELQPSSFYQFAIKSLRKLHELQQTVREQCATLADLLRTTLTVRLNHAQTAHVQVMNKFRLFKKLLTATSPESVMKGNDEEMDKVIRKILRTLIPDTTGGASRSGHVGADARPQRPLPPPAEVIDVDDVPEGVVPRRSERKRPSTTPATCLATPQPEQK